MALAYKLRMINPSEALRPRSLDELNSLADKLNETKNKLSEGARWYLENAEKIGITYDIPRLCRSLAAPEDIASSLLKKNDIYDIGKYLENRDFVKFNKEAKKTLVDMTPKLYMDSLSLNQRKAVEHDKEELWTYSQHYLWIDLAKGLEPKLYPNGNIFSHMIDIIGMGGIITRFKYVSGKNGISEKIISYHLTPSILGPEFRIHVQGDKKFKSRKMWGKGDETIEAVGRHKTPVIRWGKEDVEAFLRSDEKGEFLY